MSGSSGNSIYIEDRDTRILIDAGLSLRALEKCLKEIGRSARELSAVVLTHEHSDHTKGIYQLAIRTSVPIMGLRETLHGLLAKMPDVMPDRFTAFASGSATYNIGGLSVSTFNVSHDVPCIGFRVEGEATVAIATDLGHVDDEVMDGLSGADFVIIECNHDVQMLSEGFYPAYLKRRILSNEGHLSNEACARTVCRLVSSGCKHFVLAHMSESNNLPRFAVNAVCGALSEMGIKPGEVTVDVAPRYEMSRMFEV